MSAFDMGYSLKTVAEIGSMNCHYVEEVIPSDICHIRTDVFTRLDPLVFPIMHKVKVRQNFFFVPSRLILGDELQEEFFSCKDLNAHLPWLEIPSASATSVGRNSLFDQMECQPASGADLIIRNVLPFLMFQKIWMDYYADEILDAQEISKYEAIFEIFRQAGLSGTFDITDHPDMPRLFFKRHPVSFSKDRFTSAQPDAQRVGQVFLMNPLSLEYPLGGPLNSHPLYVQGSGYVTAEDNPANVLRSTLTVDELWDEMAVQRFLNSLNEFGNERYIEILAGQFGVISADARLQRAEWLGGNEMVVNVSEVLQTSETTQTSPQGNMSGRGIVSGRGRDISFRVPEHGFVLGVLSFVPENGYASGSPRWLYKSTPLDFAMPRFNNLGEQAVYNGELYSDHRQTSSHDLEEFGYQPQYDEYRSHPSRSTGDFRESQFLSWHLDRKFASVPPLNANFIHVSPQESSRIFADTEGTFHLRTHCFHKAMYVRPISRHPVPGKL